MILPQQRFQSRDARRPQFYVFGIRRVGIILTGDFPALPPILA